MYEIVMPAMGLAVADGTVVRWLKRPGDRVEAGDAIVEVETDKSNVEVTTRVDGWLGPHLYAEGDIVPSGTTITRVLNASEADSSLRAEYWNDEARPEEAPASPRTDETQPLPSLESVNALADDLDAEDSRPLFDWSAPTPLTEGAAPVESDPETVTVEEALAADDPFADIPEDEDESWEAIVVKEHRRPQLVVDDMAEDEWSPAPSRSSEPPVTESTFTTEGPPTASTLEEPAPVPERAIAVVPPADDGLGEKSSPETAAVSEAAAEEHSEPIPSEAQPPPDHYLRWIELLAMIDAFDSGLAQKLTLGSGTGEDGSARLPVGSPTARRAGNRAGIALAATTALDGEDHLVMPASGYHYALARGLPPEQVAEALGAHCPGSVYLAWPAQRVWGANGVVGGSGRLAVGLALASKLRGQSTVVVAFADDRDLESGRIWESCRIAARWTLPVVFVAEGRIEGALVDPGLRLVPVDGSRLANVYAATMDAVGLARAGEGPTIVVVTPPLDPLAALHEETQTTSVVEADWQSAVESGRGQAEAALATRDQNGQSAEDTR